MKQFSSEKSSVAWFKLAEFVSRGEKERALSIYRLLMHSIKDPAIVAQLEGDILCAFQDDGALQAYIKAASLYQKDERFVQAVALYERLSYIKPDDSEYGKKKIYLYEQLHQPQKLFEAAQAVIALLISQRAFSQVHDLLRDINLDIDKGRLHEQFVIGMLETGLIDRSLLHTHIARALDSIADERLQQFLSRIAVYDEQAHAYAVRYVQER